LGCHPAVDVQGSTLAYSMNSASDTLASVTVDFNVHTDQGGSQRAGFIKIKCVDGGPTSNFRYTTIGDEGHVSTYEIDGRLLWWCAGASRPAITGEGGVLVCRGHDVPVRSATRPVVQGRVHCDLPPFDVRVQGQPVCAIRAWGDARGVRCRL
jgi:hypothetical protein